MHDEKAYVEVLDFKNSKLKTYVFSIQKLEGSKRASLTRFLSFVIIIIVTVARQVCQSEAKNSPNFWKLNYDILNNSTTCTILNGNFQTVQT